MDTTSEDYLLSREIKTIQVPIAIVTILVSSFAIFLTILFFIFNIRYRNFRLIKMSSPNINNIINLNCGLLYLCPILNSIKGLNIVTNQSLANVMCQANSWLIPICSTIVYAAMLTKAWRIYRIFDTTPKMKKVVIKDIKLVFYILIMVSIDVCILLVWQFYDTIKIKSRYVYETQLQNSFDSSTSLLSTTTTTNISSSSINVITSNTLKANTTTQLQQQQQQQPINQIRILYECNSNYNEVWFTVLTIYKIILFMYGIYLAWLIRNVNVPSMNDAKYLLLSTYTIIICGLGSMTLIQLLRDWPDVVQVFFTIGIVVSTCTTQNLLFIPKILLWYQRRNDDNFKISLSQIFLQSSSSCYYSDNKGKNSPNNGNTANILNLEDELCELLHENSQLKNFLKEKEEIIKLLQEKVRATKRNLFHINDIQAEEKAIDCEITIDRTSETSIHIDQPSTTLLNQNSAPTTLTRQQKSKPTSNHHDSGYDIESASTNSPNSDNNSFENLRSPKSNIEINATVDYENTNKQNISISKYSGPFKSANIPTEKLKNDLDEVEELTSRVRDSISIDLSNTRRYSPLLYEYYRKQLDLAKSIQSTYNIQCNTLFDAMTLMKRCLKDYCQTVHNPEYFAIESLNNVRKAHELNKRPSILSNSINNYALNSSAFTGNNTSSLDNSNPMSVTNLNASTNSAFSNSTNSANRHLRKILSYSNPFNPRTPTTNQTTNNQSNPYFSSTSSHKSTATTITTTSTPSTPSTNLNSTAPLDQNISIDKQTYV